MERGDNRRTRSRSRSRSRERKEKKEERRSRWDDNEPPSLSSSSSTVSSSYKQQTQEIDMANMNKKQRLQVLSKEDTSSRSWGKVQEVSVPDTKSEKQEKEKVKEKANFGLTGALAKDEATGNVVNGIVLKWSEPLDSAIPKQLWRLYVFKGDDIVETLHIHRKSAYLFGRDDRVADVVIAHPSCSKQHAVIQYRLVDVRIKSGKGDDDDDDDDDDYEGGSGRRTKVVKPYLMDLGSTHKTFLNDKPLEDARYYELREKDSIRFAESSRSYVLLHAES